jgi:molybdopterin-guanine dinucleotide biosynthesis protein MobB
MPIDARISVVGFVAPSGTGKTTLLEQVIPHLRAHGLRVGLVKHTHHRFDIDRPGKDSYRLRAAGARQVMVGSSQRWALMTELEETLPEPSLALLLSQMDQEGLDLILVEGFKHEAFPKIELHRQALGEGLLHPHDRDIVAVATDTPLPTDLPQLDINDPDAIADFLLRLTGVGQEQQGDVQK